MTNLLKQIAEGAADRWIQNHVAAMREFTDLKEEKTNAEITAE